MKTHVRSAHTQDLLSLRDLLEEKTGLYLSPEKLGRLEEPFKEPRGSLASTSPAKVFQAMTTCSEEGRAYLNQLIAAVTTHETYFFRMPSQFDALKNHLLPELIYLKRSQGRKTLRIWSAGCSTGEEPYSLAVFLLDSFPDIGSWEVYILATDIDLAALKKAREGIYRPWSFRGVGAEIIEKYFHPLEGDCYRIDDRVRSWITFRPLNLKSDPYPSLLNGTSDLDIIFCRNVTIYFQPETTQEVVRRFYACLNKGGFLLAGAAEYSSYIYQDFEARVFPETVVYQKPSSPKQIPRPKPLSLLLPLSPVKQSPPPTTLQAKVESAAQKNGEIDPVDEVLELISQGEVDKALVFLADQAAKTPQDSRLCFLLGQICADRHHLREAVYWLSRTLTLDPLHLWAHYLLALLWIEENKMGEALQSLKKTVYIEPNFALGHFYLGRTYRKLGENEKARKSFTAAKSLLGSIPLSEKLQGEEAMTAQQLLPLVDRELNDEG